MTTVIVNMTDLFTGKIVTRQICVSNITIPDYSAALNSECSVIPKHDAIIRNKLNEWILNRANQQHNTLLELESYRIV
jgi:hypothetical protein